MRAVILAGGRGTRLAPYTTLLPKPLMPVGDMPILELLIRRLTSFGIDHVTIAVGHLAGLIRAYLASQEDWGTQIDYSFEAQPLGTAGPLRLVQDLTEPFLVMNGDLLTDLDFGDLIQAHSSSGAVATVGTFQRHVRIELGVLECADGVVSDYTEKPTYTFLVSMGVYVLNPSVLPLIPADRPFDLPDLVSGLLSAGERVASHRHNGYWLDIGRPDDFDRAQRDFESMRELLVPRRSPGSGQRGETC